MAIHKILVVDDSLTQRLVLSAILAEQGYQVVTANDGTEAVTKAKSELPDLIIMDVVMPVRRNFDVSWPTQTLKLPLPV